ncbi:sugar nucleotide-binding protein [Nocardiopsis alba]|uniref:sugar nucleotide-binding protein n=1 Tax=Nocardiopsis alba TaxID=53437 RepID=UPI00366D6C75
MSCHDRSDHRWQWVPRRRTDPTGHRRRTHRHGDVRYPHRSPPGAEWRRLDLRRPEAITSLFEEVRPTVVINTAYRRSDWATAADGAIRVAMAALDQGARLVQVSSDTVFSGDRVHYDETSTPDPVTPYGAAKAAAETAIRLLDSQRSSPAPR